MKFDLYVTFSGLCLLVRRPRSKELLVLMPETSGMHEHVAVLGSHKKHQPQVSVPPRVTMVEHRLGKGEVGLDHVRTPDDLETSLAGRHVKDLTPCAGKRTKPASALVSIRVAAGAVSRNSDPGDMAEWSTDEGDGPRLATSITWKFSSVENTIGDGRPGLSVQIPDAATGRPKTVELLAVEVDDAFELKMYLHNVLPDELPSVPGNPPARPIEPGQDAPHFKHYFDLFDGAVGCKPPKFKKHARKNLGRLIEERSFDGRRYTCIIASVEE